MHEKPHSAQRNCLCPLADYLYQTGKTLYPCWTNTAPICSLPPAFAETLQMEHDRWLPTPADSPQERWLHECRNIQRKKCLLGILRACHVPVPSGAVGYTHSKITVLQRYHGSSQNANHPFARVHPRTLHPKEIHTPSRQAPHRRTSRTADGREIFPQDTAKSSPA